MNKSKPPMSALGTDARGADATNSAPTTPGAHVIPGTRRSRRPMARRPRSAWTTNCRTPKPPPRTRRCGAGGAIEFVVLAVALGGHLHRGGDEQNAQNAQADDRHRTGRLVQNHIPPHAIDEHVGVAPGARGRTTCRTRRRSRRGRRSPRRRQSRPPRIRIVRNRGKPEPSLRSVEVRERTNAGARASTRRGDRDSKSTRSASDEADGRGRAEKGRDGPKRRTLRLPTAKASPRCDARRDARRRAPSIRRMDR